VVVVIRIGHRRDVTETCERRRSRDQPGCGPVIDGLPTLPDAVKAGIVAMVKAAGGSD